MNIRIDSSWGYRLPVRFRDGANGAAGEPQTGFHHPMKQTPVPISRRLAIYRISQFNETEIKIGGSD